MKIIKISTRGVDIAETEIITGAKGNYYCIHHGENGRGRWQVSFPLVAKEFPSPQLAGNLKLTDNNYKLIPLGKKDKKENERYLIGIQNTPDNNILVLLNLSPGYRGGATYKVEGEAKVIAEGYEADGLAGRMGGAACPAILVTGPCVIEWKRYGRLYGTEPNWKAEYNGEKWHVGPKLELEIEDEAFA